MHRRCIARNHEPLPAFPRRRPEQTRAIAAQRCIRRGGIIKVNYQIAIGSLKIKAFISAADSTELSHYSTSAAHRLTPSAAPRSHQRRPRAPVFDARTSPPRRNCHARVSLCPRIRFNRIGPRQWLAGAICLAGRGAALARGRL